MRRAWAVAAATALLAAGAAGSDATVAEGKAGPVVPVGFFGVSATSHVWEAKRPDREFSRMRADGAESVTSPIYWHDLQPFATAESVPADVASQFPLVDGVPTSYAVPDRLYLHAARAGLRVLPVALGAPGWAKLDASRTWSPPADPTAYGHFISLLVHRYGPGGTFWAEHPKLKALPTRDWQIWNEPTGFEGSPTPSFFWDAPKPYEPRYVEMLKASHAAVHAADPNGRVLLGGMLGASWDAINALYKAGAGPYFDGAALHPYTAAPSNVLASLEFVRDILDRYGDTSKPLMITEFGWPSAQGRIPDSKLHGFETSAEGQAYKIEQSFPLLVAARARLRLTSVFWYTWMTRDQDRRDAFDFAGLRRLRPDGTVVPKPAEARYKSFALKFEGCQRKLNKRPARCRQ